MLVKVEATDKKFMALFLPYEVKIIT